MFKVPLYVQVFETPNVGLQPGHVRTNAIERALTTYLSPPLHSSRLS